MIEVLWDAFKIGPQWVILAIVVFILFEMRNREEKNKERHDNTMGAISAVKTDVSAMKSRMDCFESSQHACQLENAKSFATKEEVDDVYAKIDDHERRISRIEGSKR